MTEITRLNIFRTLFTKYTTNNSKYPPHNELEEIVNLWKAQFNAWKNKEDLDLLISSVNKWIQSKLIKGNKLLRKELSFEDYYWLQEVK